ncbi:MAG: hypothetical protein IJE22_01635 [Oscillibacter sp.]|nr:hypothetical protein [Oscillibacter sp.]
MEILEYLELAVLALGCFLAALILKSNRAAILQYTTQLVNAAEQAVQGSGMGEAKKALVIAQLKAAGIHVGRWLEGMIDQIVDKLNATGAWLATQAKQHAADLQEDANA